MPALRRGAPWAALAALSLPLAWGLGAAGFPAALLLGPMLAGIAVALYGLRLRIPVALFIGAQSIVGCLIGRAVTGAILVSLARDGVELLLVVMTTVGAGGAVGWLLVRYGTLPGSTAAWGTTPGASSAMIAMAEEFGADVRLVALMQYLRLIVVVLTASLMSRLLLGPGQEAVIPAALPADATAPPASLFPWLLSLAETLAIAGLGGWVGRRLGVPAGTMLVPMIAAAALHLGGVVEITLPPAILALAYAFLGWYVGLGFNRDVLRYAFRAMPQLLLGTFLLIGLCGVSAWLLTRILHIDGLTAYLATSPGGLDSVAVIAIGSRADIPMVLAVQTLRVLVVVLAGPQIAKLISRYA